jgi:hypothetical protein
MKKYQVTANIILIADGWVRAKNKEEAKKKYEEFLTKETKGLSIGEIDIREVLSKKSRHFDKKNEPVEKDFDETWDDCICSYYLN